MGRGEQMSMYDIEKSVAGAGLGSVTKRRIVIAVLVSFFLPFVITSSYLFYTSPDAANQAMLYLQRRPFSNSSPVSEATNTSSLDITTTSSNRNTTTEAEVEVKEAEVEAKEAEIEAKEAEVEAKEAKVDAKEAAIEAKEAKVEAKEAAIEAKEAEIEAKEAEIETKEAILGAKSEVRETSDLGAENTTTSANATTEELLTEELSNPTSSIEKEVCDLVKGSWVPDPRPPQYTNSTCQFIQGHQNCMKNGRKDTGYLYWKWKPDHCELPRINPKVLLTALRDRSMLFVGDSIARNQFQSILCVLSQVESPDHIYNAPDDRDNVWLFRKHNFTLGVYWSPYLVHVEDKQIAFAPENKTQTVAFIHVDRCDKAWADRISGVDIVQISTGQWWFKRGLFLEGGKVLGGHICDGWADCQKEIGFADPYRAAIRTVLRGSLFVPGYTGTTILRTFAPEHFEGGSWSNGGKCVRTEPGGVEMNSLTKWMYDIQMDEFHNLTSSLSGVEKDRLRVLDVTNIAQIRADGHPNAFMKFQPFAKEFTERIINDCLHWCLPGPIDTWNDLLVESLHDLVYRE